MRFLTAPLEALRRFVLRPERGSQHPDDVIARGDRAEDALRSDVVAEALREVNLTYMEQLINSKPEEADRREYLHHRIAAVQDVMLMLKGYMGERHAALAEREAREEEADQEGL